MYVNRKRESSRKGDGRGESSKLTLCLKIDIIRSMGNPKPAFDTISKVTLTPKDN
jgi:hypothetical protein